MKERLKMSQRETQASRNCFQSITRNIQMWAIQVKATTFRSNEICAWLARVRWPIVPLHSHLPCSISSSFRSPLKPREYVKYFSNNNRWKPGPQATHKLWKLHKGEERKKNTFLYWQRTNWIFFFSQWAFLFILFTSQARLYNLPLPKDLTRIQTRGVTGSFEAINWCFVCLWKDVSVDTNVRISDFIKVLLWIEFKLKVIKVSATFRYVTDERPLYT